MANTYTLITSSTLSSGASAAITFSSIPQTYTDLCLVASVRSDRAANLNDYLAISFNGSLVGFTSKILTGNGASASSTTGTYYGGEINAATSTASTFSSVQIYIPNYAGSANKSFSVDSAMENNATTAYLTADAGIRSNTAAITSITVQPNAGSNLTQYSSVYLYGIKNS